MDNNDTKWITAENEWEQHLISGETVIGKIEKLILPKSYNSVWRVEALGEKSRFTHPNQEEAKIEVGRMISAIVERDLKSYGKTK